MGADIGASSFATNCRITAAVALVALDFGQAAYDSLDKEADVLRADLGRLKDRYKADAPPGLFEPCDTDLKSLEAKTKDAIHVHSVLVASIIGCVLQRFSVLSAFPGNRGWLERLKKR